MTMDPVSSYKKHRKLWQKLMNYKWSTTELEWLLAHPQQLDLAMERFIRDKLAAARQEKTHAKDQAL